MGVLLYFLLILFTIAYIIVYGKQLSIKSVSNNDSIYTSNSIKNFDEALKHIEDIELAYKIKCVGVREQLDYYRQNAEETERGFEYYEEYIVPYLKRLEINEEVSFSAANKLFDKKLRLIFVMLLVICLAPFIVQTFLNHERALREIAIFIILVSIGLSLFALSLYLLKYYLEGLLKSKASNKAALGKSILAIETFIAAVSSKKYPGLEVIHDNHPNAGPDGIIFGGVGGLSGGSGSSAGGMGGGSFGGGGAGGSW